MKRLFFLLVLLPAIYAESVSASRPRAALTRSARQHQRARDRRFAIIQRQRREAAELRAELLAWQAQQPAVRPNLMRRSAIKAIALLTGLRTMLLTEQCQAMLAVPIAAQAEVAALANACADAQRTLIPEVVARVCATPPVTTRLLALLAPVAQLARYFPYQLILLAGASIKASWQRLRR